MSVTNLLLLSFLCHISAYKLDSIACGFPGVPGLYGSFDLPSKTFEIGQNVSYNCPDGLAIVGPIHRTCLADGTWNSVIPQCVPSVVERVLDICRDMNAFEIHFPKGVFPKKIILHGFEKVTFGIPHEHVFTEFEVDPENENIVNYNLSRPLKVCSYQVFGWMGNLACGLPEVPAHAISRLDSEREKVNYTCLSGYQLVGPSSRHCTAKYLWGQSQATCVKLSPDATEKQKITGDEDGHFQHPLWEGFILFFGLCNTVLWLVVVALLVIQRRQRNHTNFNFWVRGSNLTSSSSLEPLCLDIQDSDKIERVTKIKEISA